MAEVNAEATEYWNGPGGQRWANDADTYERQLEAWIEPLLRSARLDEGQRVLDVGCGAGPTTRAAAERVGPRGEAVGVDVSAPLLEQARARTSAPNVRFVEADAQVAPLAELCGGPVDRAISRFGVMFFDDPVAAFANVRAALAPGGRLTVITWRPVDENPWMNVPGHALADAVGVPFVSPGHGPGPFSLADRGRIESVLVDAGFDEVGFERLDLPFAIGGGVDAATAAEFGYDPLTQFLPEGGAEVSDRDAAVAALRELFEDHQDEHGHVVLPSGSWIVTADKVPAR